MKKFFLALMFLALITGLSTTASYAGADCEPGCDCKKAADGSYQGSIFGEQQNHAEAKQVQQKGYAQEIIKMPDNAPGMTCLDRALGLTSMLGNIFSDKIPQNIPAMSSSIFGPSAFPDAGTGTKNPDAPGGGGPYGKALKNVISDSLKQYATNFDDTGLSDGSLSAQLGATSLNYVEQLGNNLIGGILQDTGINSAMTALDGANGLFNEVAGFWNSYGGIVANALSAFPGLAGLINIIGQAFSVLNDITSTIATIQQTFNQLQANLMGILNNLVNVDHMLSGDGKACNRIGDLWGKLSDTGLPAGFKALTGSGSDQGAPYFNFRDMLENPNLQAAGISIGTNMGRALMTGEPILQKAWEAISTGILSGPGASATWPAVPVIPQNASVDDIISLMN